jgi:hypothetical protein
MSDLRRAVGVLRLCAARQPGAGGQGVVLRHALGGRAIGAGRRATGDPACCGTRPHCSECGAGAVPARAGR